MSLLCIILRIFPTLWVPDMTFLTCLLLICRVIGGNIPGETRVVSTQIFGHVEAMEYTQAHWLAAGMVVFSFVVLIALSLLKKRSDRILP